MHSKTEAFVVSGSARDLDRHSGWWHQRVENAVRGSKKVEED